MQQVTVGTRNQIVLPKEVRRKIKGLKPGSKVTVYPIDAYTVQLKVSDQDWVERGYGLMKNAWKDIDPSKEIEKMRKEWDEK